MEFRRIMLPLCLLAGLLLLVPACSDDDDPTGPGNGGGDTTAPEVTSIVPEEEQTMVDTSPEIIITFNEAMDQTGETGESGWGRPSLEI